MTPRDAFRLARDNSLVTEYHRSLRRGGRVVVTLLYWAVGLYFFVSFLRWCCS